MFNFFKKKPASVETKIRKKLATSFDELVLETVSKSDTNNPMLGLMVQATIANLYQSLKDSSELNYLCQINGLDYSSILDDECNKALHKYLE